MTNKKIKITYFENFTNNILAKILFFEGWDKIETQMLNEGILLNDILKIEVFLEASDENTYNTTL